jgi:16S rRNA (guanine1516-N2)-methyltransferase
MILTVGDSTKILTALQAEKPDVIFLDPMYPHREKSALVKKEMRFIRLLAGDDQDSAALLKAALAKAKQRVVVKRPKLAPPLSGPEPSFTISSKKNRFDVYLI